MKREVFVNQPDSALRALAIKRFGISFWDALVMHAAESSGARTLYSEDFNNGQTYGNVQVVNPFNP